MSFIDGVVCYRSLNLFILVVGLSMVFFVNFDVYLVIVWFDRGKSEVIVWEKIKFLIDEVVVFYDKMVEFFEGNNFCMCEVIFICV